MRTKTLLLAPTLLAAATAFAAPPDACSLISKDEVNRMAKKGDAVHVEKRGPAMQISGYDEHDDVDPGLLEFVVATAGDAIMAAAWLLSFRRHYGFFRPRQHDDSRTGDRPPSSR